jgi:hypothetical protein
MLKTSIYNNLIPPKTFYETINACKILFLKLASTSCHNKLNKSQEEFGQFLNITHDKEVVITNPVVKKNLEMIKYYGPMYSHCPSCRNRTLSFYETMHPNESLRLIDYIKTVKK